MTDLKNRTNERLDRMAEKDAQERRLFWRGHAANWLREMRRDPGLNAYIICARGLAHAMECYKKSAVDAMRIRNYRG